MLRERGEVFNVQGAGRIVLGADTLFFVVITVVLAEIQISGKRVLTLFFLKRGLSGSPDKLTRLLKNNSRESRMLPRLRGLKVG